MDDALKIGVYVLLVLPGFIFVQTREYHLLREKRSQFEKTLEIVLWSAALWIIACASPTWWPSDPRILALREARATIRDSAAGVSLDWPKLLNADAALFFGSVCLWSFVGANFWGYLRKTRYIDASIRWVTGRDWYPSVKQKFFDKNLNAAVIVQTPSARYLGILFSVPDTKEDPHIILSEVSLLPKPGDASREIEPLPLVRWVLIKFDDIIEIQALTSAAVEQIDSDSKDGKRGEH
ncbi:MAG: hypothetical protein IVW54_16130 [Candidatus Binataceae bacterium]|nr:hypothetical protein [Candidatus Binataceae bacterium]